MTAFNPRRRWTAWLRWPDAESGPLHIGLTWSGTENGRATLVGVEMWSRPPGAERVSPGPEGNLADSVLAAEEITVARLRALPLASLARDTRRHLIEALAAAPRARGRRGAAAEAAAEGLRQREGSRYPPEFYRQVAAVYREAVSQGLEPYAAIAARWPASKSAIAKWVARCRHDLGLLPQTTRGRPAA